MGLFPKDRDLNRTLEELDLELSASTFREKADGFQMRLDHFLAHHLSWRSRTSIQELVRDGWVAVDAATPDHPRGRGELSTEKRPGRRLGHGSKVRITIPPESRRLLEVEGAGEVEVIYEDEAVLAVDKPPLVPVHPSGRHFHDTLIQRVHARFATEVRDGLLAPRLCHRLDRETSGIVLIAKDRRSHTLVSGQFEERYVDKEYLAIVHGVMREDAGELDMALGPATSSRIRLKMAVRADGLPSRTDFEVVERLERVTLVRCRLFTGRQHQIRVHLASIGHPLVGDKLYGEDEGVFERAAEGELGPDDLARLELPRHALHHAQLGFRTPDGSRRVVIESRLAPDLEQYLREHRTQRSPASSSI